MNKYQEALNRMSELCRIIPLNMRYGLSVKDAYIPLKELVDSQEKLKTIIKKYELELYYLKEYAQGHSLLNSLICDLNELVGESEDE